MALAILFLSFRIATIYRLRIAMVGLSFFVLLARIWVLTRVSLTGVGFFSYINFPHSIFYIQLVAENIKMVHMENRLVDDGYDNLADLLLGKENVRIKVHVIHLWKVPAFLKPSEYISLEFVLVDEKVGVANSVFFISIVVSVFRFLIGSFLILSL
jgi:hypothetical protein